MKTRFRSLTHGSATRLAGMALCYTGLLAVAMGCHDATGLEDQVSVTGSSQIVAQTETQPTSLQVTITVTNTSPFTISIPTGACGLRFSLYASDDPDAEAVWTLPEYACLLDLVSPKRLAPGEHMTYASVSAAVQAILDDIEPGHYYVRAFGAIPTKSDSVAAGEVDLTASS